LHWLGKPVFCGLAVLFAATGVYKVTADDAGTWQIVHGIVRVAFGTSVVIGMFWPGNRSGENDAEPSDGSEDRVEK
jgi:hypothetical protein